MTTSTNNDTLAAYRAGHAAGVSSALGITAARAGDALAAIGIEGTRELGAVYCNGLLAGSVGDTRLLDELNASDDEARRLAANVQRLEAKLAAVCARRVGAAR